MKFFVVSLFLLLLISCQETGGSSNDSNNIKPCDEGTIIGSYNLNGYDYNISLDANKIKIDRTDNQYTGTINPVDPNQNFVESDTEMKYDYTIYKPDGSLKGGGNKLQGYFNFHCTSLEICLLNTVPFPDSEYNCDTYTQI
ncbi:MAG: hypothetical protein ACJAS4_001418 [Bacteriovoracaceae bacterium]|jgi:hypothetical protein